MKGLLLLACLAFAACVGPPPPHPPDDPQAPKIATVYVIDHGWHTDLGIPMDSVTGPFAAFQRIFPGVHYLVVGFGERSFFEAAENTPLDTVRAIFPGPGIVLATALNTAPVGAYDDAPGVVGLRVTQAQLDRLSDFVWNTLEKGPDFMPVRHKDGPYPGAVFFAASTDYMGTFTCNTWSAEALSVAGLPIEASGVLFARQVMDRARQAAALDPVQPVAAPERLPHS